LNGARLKVVRAQQHLQSLDEEIGRYLDRKPYHVTLDRQGDMAVFRLVTNEDPPPCVSAIIGDCVTNLRAALDYIAWELAAKHAPRPLTETEERQVTFPLLKSTSTKADFSGNKAAAHLMKVCGVPAATMDVIESVQPYHTGYEVLEKLNLLVNHDKHRALLPCIGCIPEAGKITIRHEGGQWNSAGGALIGVQLKTPEPGRPPPPPPEVEMEGEPPIFVAFKEPPMKEEGATFVLANAIKCITDIIPRFDPLF
jgi:hypothetical protein